MLLTGLPVWERRRKRYLINVNKSQYPLNLLMRNGKQQTDRLFILILFFKEEEECCGGNIVECRLIGNCARGKYTNKDIRLPSQKKDERNIGKKITVGATIHKTHAQLHLRDGGKGLRKLFPSSMRKIVIIIIKKNKDDEEIQSELNQL